MIGIIDFFIFFAAAKKTKQKKAAFAARKFFLQNGKKTSNGDNSSLRSSNSRRLNADFFHILYEKDLLMRRDSLRCLILFLIFSLFVPISE